MSGTTDVSLLARIASKTWPGLRLVLVVYVLWLALAWVLQRGILFPRYATTVRPSAGEDMPGLERHHLATDDGEVEWWFIPGARADPSSPAPTVVYAHGNAELIDYQADVVGGYRELGVNIVLCEFRGYGRSEGSPSQAAITEDFVQVRDALAVREDVDQERIFYHGRSVGTGAACALAAERPPAALLLTSPFTSVADMMTRYLVPRWFVRDPFDNQATLADVRVPTLIMHGDRDTIIPVAHGKKLASSAPSARLLLYEGIGHNDFPGDRARYWGDIAGFLRENDILTE